MRPRSTAALVALALVAAWWFSRERAASPKPQIAPPAPSSETTGREPPQAEGSATPARATPPVEPKAQAPTIHRRIDGRLVVLDASGVPHAEESGWFGEPLALADSDDARARRIEVRAGRFTIDAEPGDVVATEIAELGGRLAWFDEESVEIAAESPLLLQAHWIAPVTLRVVDARSGAELDEITVLRSRIDQQFDDPHPGDLDATAVVAEHARSPFELELGTLNTSIRWSESLWVGAPGRAWTSVDVDHRAGGTREVALAPGAGLSLRLIGTLPKGPPATTRVHRGSGDERESKAPRVRIRRLRDVPPGTYDADEMLGAIVADVTPAQPEPMVLTGLPPGPSIATLEVGRAGDRPTVIARARVELRAGERADATLELPPPPVPRAGVPLAGTITQSPAWGARAPALEFEPIDRRGTTSKDVIELDDRKCEPIDGEPGRFRFDLGVVGAGRFVVREFERGFAQIVDTGATGRRDVELVIGDPAEVVIRPTDAESGAPVAFEEGAAPRVTWSATAAGAPESARSHDAEWDESERGWRLRAAPGDVEVTLRSPRFDGHANVRLASGANELPLPITRSCGIVLFLESDDGRIDWPERAFRQVRVESADGRSVRFQPWAWPDRGLALVVREPGGYRVVVELDGFEPSPPLPITVTPGDFPELVVTLRRNR